MDSRDIGELRKHLAINIRAGRAERGFTQERLSLESDIDRTYVSQLERGRGNPSLNALANLARTLGLDVLDLLAVPKNPDAG